MSVTAIRTKIDRLFGDMTRDKRTALLDMRAIAKHAGQYAALLDNDDFDDEDEDFDDFDDDFDDEDDCDATEGDLY